MARRNVHARPGALGAAVALATMVAGGCGNGNGLAEVDFRILSAPGADPYAGAQELRLVLERGRREVEAQRFDPGAQRLDLGPLEFDTGLQFRLDVLRGRDVPLARGRSYPFDVTAAGASLRPDLLVMRLGNFVTPTPTRPRVRVVGVTSAEGGAVLATIDGRLFRYRAHGAMDGTATLDQVALLDAREGASWTGLGPSRLLAVGGQAGGAVLVAADGERVAQLPGSALADHAQGAALARLPGRQAAIAVGGQTASGQPSTAVTRVELSEGELRAVSLPPLPMPLQGAEAVAVRLPDRQGDEVTRVVAAGGRVDGASSSVAMLVDPGGDAVPTTHDLGMPRQGAALAVPQNGVILVVGGGDAGAPSTEVTARVVRPGALQRLEPAPGSLVQARSRATAIRFDPGLVLVVGGVDGDGQPVRRAELVDTRTLPGRVDATGELPAGLAHPCAHPLGDGTVLVAGADGVAVHAPARGF